MPDTVRSFLSRTVQRGLWTATLVMVLLIVLGSLVFGGSNGQGSQGFHSQLELFSLFALLSAFFLASAKYVVSRERFYFSLCLGLLAATIFDLLHLPLDLFMNAPFPFAHANEGSGYLWFLGRIAFGAGLLGAVLSLRTSSLLDERPGTRLAFGSLLAFVTALFFALLIMVLPLPPYYEASLPSGPSFPLFELGPLVLYVGTVFIFFKLRNSVHSRLLLIGILTLLLATLTQIFAFSSQQPNDALFFAAHFAKIGSYMVLLFGLFLDHAQSYSLERGVRESLELAHADLKSAKMELDAIIDNLTDGIVIVDEQGKLIRFNRAAQEIAGQIIPGLRLERYTETYHVETVDGRPFPLEEYPVVRALKTSRPVSGQEMILQKIPTGERRWIVAGASPLFNGQGRLRGAVAAFSDVTDIRSTEQRFRDLTESAPDGVLVLNDQGRIVLFNQAAERLFGYSREEMFGKEFQRLLPENVRQEFSLDNLRSRFDSGTSDEPSQPLRLLGIRKSGRELVLEISGSISHTATNSFTVLHVRDATERERIQREREGLLSIALAASATQSEEEFLQRAVASIPETTGFEACVLYVHDPQRNALVLRVSHGISDEVKAQIQHYPLNPSFPSIAVQTWFQKRILVESRLHERIDLAIAHHLLKKHGYQSLISAPLESGGQQLGVLQVVAPEKRQTQEEDSQLLELLAHELALALHQKRLVKELQSHADALRVANQEMDAFVYTVSHDLAEPLRSITNFCHFLMEDHAKQLNDEGRDYLERVNRGALRMKQLLDDLLRLSRLGRSQVPHLRVNVAELLEEVRESLDATLRNRQAQLRLEGDLPDVVGDRTGLAEVFSNLISNGIKFNQSPSPVLLVRGTRKGGLVEFEVQDNGIGISPEHYDRIFGLFARLHPRNAYPGTGAGLAIVRKIVEIHGGRIWVASTLGAGSTFHFTLPAAPASIQKLEVSERSSPVA